MVPDENGELQPIKVRPRQGLAAMEYLMDAPLVREQARVLIGLTTALRKIGYEEWDGENGNLLAAAYDWRLMPAVMEERDGFLTNILDQTEAMVSAHPDKKPACVLAHSMGCKVAKY